MKRQCRFDNKGNLLRPREHQRKDSGKYEFKYKNVFGISKTVTAATLEELRIREKEIQLGKDPDSENLFKMFFEIWKTTRALRVSDKTMNNYLLIYKNHIEKVFADIDVTKIDPFSIEAYYTALYRKTGLSVTLIDSIHTVLYGILDVARKKRVIPDNPAAGATDCLREARSRAERKKKEKVVSKSPRDKYMIFLLEKYSGSPEVLIIFLMAMTGCRFGEAAGLTNDDIDLERKTMDINHTISYGYKKLGTKEGEKSTCGFIISPVKTAKSEREVPLPDVKLIEAIRKRIRKNKCIKKIKIDGYKNFIFIKETGIPYTDRNLNDFIKRTSKEYNTIEAELAKNENREAILLPDNITCHTFRHTAATIMSAANVPMPTIQKILGHVDIRTTGDVYCHSTVEADRKAVGYLSLGE